MSTRNEFFQGLEDDRRQEVVEIKGGRTVLVKEPSYGIEETLQKRGYGDVKSRLYKLIHCTFQVDEDENPITDENGRPQKMFSDGDMQRFLEAGGQLKELLNEILTAVLVLENGVSLEEYKEVQDEVDPEGFDSVESYYHEVWRRVRARGEEAEGNSKIVPDGSSSGG